MKDKDIEIYSEGLCALSVCVPNNATREEIERAVNAVHPSGIDSRWKISVDKTFKTGNPNPCDCEHTPTRKHYLLNC